MEPVQQLAFLVDLAEAAGIVIRPAPPGSQGESGGAFVRLRGQEILFLDLSATPADQIAVVVSAIRDRAELQDRFIPPEIRQLFDADGPELDLSGRT